MKPGQLYFKFANKPGYTCIPLAAFGEEDQLIDILTALFPNANRDCLFRASSNKIVSRLHELPYSNNNFVQVIPRVRAGKGGFGTLMKNQAMQKRRFTDTFAAKDLNGRRMRDVKNEIKLKKWILRRTENRSKLENDPVSNKAVSADKLQHARIIQTLTESKQFVKNVSKWNAVLQQSIVQGLEAVRKSRSENPSPDEISCLDDNPEKLANILANIASKRTHITAPRIGITNQLVPKGNDLTPTALVPNKDKPANDVSSSANANPSIDLTLIDTIKDLNAFDPETIKNYLKSIGVKCGGTPEERVKRLWDIKCNPALLLDKKFLASKATAN